MCKRLGPVQFRCSKYPLLLSLLKLPWLLFAWLFAIYSQSTTGSSRRSSSLLHSYFLLFVVTIIYLETYDWISWRQLIRQKRLPGNVDNSEPSLQCNHLRLGGLSTGLFYQRASFRPMRPCQRLDTQCKFD